MGKFDKGILGHVDGKVGTIVGSTWRGVNYMKSKPKRSKKPPTEKQMMQQEKFALVSRFVRTLGDLVKDTFNDPTADKSGINRAFSYNIMHAIAGTYPGYTLDYSKALVSEGKLHNAYLPNASATGSGIVKYTWTPNTGANANATDLCVGVVYCPGERQAVYTITGDARSSGGHQLDAILFTGKTVETWIYFISADGMSNSSSVYTGQLTIT